MNDFILAQMFPYTSQFEILEARSRNSSTTRRSSETPSFSATSNCAMCAMHRRKCADAHVLLPEDVMVVDISRRELFQPQPILERWLGDADKEARWASTQELTREASGLEYHNRTPPPGIGHAVAPPDHTGALLGYIKGWMQCRHGYCGEQFPEQSRLRNVGSSQRRTYSDLVPRICYVVM